METYHLAQMLPYQYRIYEQQKLNTQSLNTVESNGNGTFRDTLQNVLSTTESLENIFREASEQYGVSLNLLKAIGKAESNFNPQAQSSAGAQGVMQLMPATARSLGVTDSFDARSNIMGGAKYIASLLERYNGDTVLALSAYNAGSGNVEKYSGVPPFKETQNYIQKVLKYAGENLDAGSITVSGAQKLNPYQILAEKNAENGEKNLGFSFNKENAQYMIEQMKAQLQSMIYSNLFFADDSDKDGQGIL